MQRRDQGACADDPQELKHRTLAADAQDEQDGMPGSRDHARSAHRLENSRLGHGHGHRRRRPRSRHQADLLRMQRRSSSRRTRSSCLRTCTTITRPRRTCVSLEIDGGTLKVHPRSPLGKGLEVTRIKVAWANAPIGSSGRQRATRSSTAKAIAGDDADASDALPCFVRHAQDRSFTGVVRPDG